MHAATTNRVANKYWPRGNVRQSWQLLSRYTYLMRSSRSIRVLLAWSSSLCATAARISGLCKVQKGQQDIRTVQGTGGQQDIRCARYRRSAGYPDCARYRTSAGYQDCARYRRVSRIPELCKVQEVSRISGLCKVQEVSRISGVQDTGG
jgi:hypothetical protein